MSCPTFVCLHGAWHDPSYFDEVKKRLIAKGYPCICPSLPPVGGNPPTPDFSADVSTIREVLLDLVHGKEVIVITHSYSGVPGGEALRGLDLASCKEKGWKGGVVKLVYIMSSMVSAGFQHSSRGTRDGMVDVMHTDMEKGIVTLKAEDAKDLLYQDLPDDQALARGKRLRPQSIGVYWSKTSYAAWRHIPTVYVVCKQDAPATVTAVRWLIEAVRGQPDNKVENVIELNTGDSPFLSQPDTIVGIFENLTQRKAV